MAGILFVLRTIMKRWYFILTTIALIAIFNGNVWANTYYVSTQGNDNNPGTAAAPWATLQYAVDTIAPGDTILVGAGTYPGCRIGSSGLVGSAKALKADLGAKVLINAPGPANR